MWNFHGSLFLALEFLRERTQFYIISRGWPLFCLEFPGIKKRTEKFQGSFHKSISSTLPVWFFSGIAHSKVCLFTSCTRQQINKISKQILKDWLSSSLDVTKTKTVAPHITYLMWSLELLLTIFPIFVGCWQVPSMFVFTLHLHFHALILQSYRNHVKAIFKDLARVDLAVL